MATNFEQDAETGCGLLQRPDFWAVAERRPAGATGVGGYRYLWSRASVDASREGNVQDPDTDSADGSVCRNQSSINRRVPFAIAGAAVLLLGCAAVVSISPLWRPATLAVRSGLKSSIAEEERCCTAETAECLACASWMPVPEFCAMKENKKIPGCQDPCCTEKTAQCLSCEASVPVASFCALAANQHVAGCESYATSKDSSGQVGKSPDEVEVAQGSASACCSERTATCLACQTKQPVSTFCLQSQNQNVSGCTGGCQLIEDDYDYPGGDFLTIPHVHDVGACCNRCRLEPRCTSWTWGEHDSRFPHMCFLKNQVELKRRPAPGVKSGLPFGQRGNFLLKNRAGLCLQWWGASNVTLEECSTTPIDEQRWVYDARNGNIRTLQGACLDELERDLDARVVALSECTAGVPSQYWAYDSQTGRASTIFNYCLSAPERTVPGTTVMMAVCNELSDDQAWSFWNAEVAGVADTVAAMRAEAVMTHPTTTTTVAPSGSLFCFTLMTPWGYEPELVTAQVQRRLGIFQCDGFAVYSNQVKDLGNGIVTRFVDVDLRCPIGGPFNTALNTYIFEKVWQQVITDGVFKNYDWVVKLDADAVFLPQRLRHVLMPLNSRAQDYQGLFINNCHFGLHGPIEILSRRALEVYGEGQENCNKPLQEDVYLQSCLLVLGVNQVNQFNVLDEDHCNSRTWATCQANYTSFHPFKDAASWQQCLTNALQVGFPI